MVHDGTVSLINFMAKFAWWYGMLQSNKPIRVEYVVRLSSVTTISIGHWKVFESINHGGKDIRSYRQKSLQIPQLTLSFTNWQFLFSLDVLVNNFSRILGLFVFIFVFLYTLRRFSTVQPRVCGQRELGRWGPSPSAAQLGGGSWNNSGYSRR